MSETTSAVMIVEDDPSFVYLVQRYVGNMGRRLVATTEGKKALALAQQERPAAIVLDVGLPEVDGRDILHALKADRITCDIPVLMCSGWSEENWRVEGADGYLQKPVLYRDFLAALVSVGVGPS